MFTKGHRINVGRSNPHSGRKKKPSTLIREAIAADACNLPLYFQALSNKARNGDREAAIYLIDRHIGKPKQQTDIELTGGEKLGVGLIAEIGAIVAMKRKELLEEQKLLDEPDRAQTT